MLALTGIVDWQDVTGQTRFAIDLVTIPFFSALAGYITNWTGVLMLFAPIRFSGFRVPGLRRLFWMLPRRIQILPMFAPGGILGFQGFVPARAEKMASLAADKGLAQVGSLQDFVAELDLDAIARHLAVSVRPQLPQIVEGIMRRDYPDVWRDLPPQLRGLLISRVAERFDTITHRAVTTVLSNMDDLVDIKLLAVGHLSRNPKVLKDIFYTMGAPELKFMVRIGWQLGFPMGLILALYLHVHHQIWGLSFIPAWVMVLLGASTVGVIVNIIAIKVVFEPGDPHPRYKYLWKQAKLAKRQHEAAGQFGYSIAHKVMTLGNITRELLYGPRADKTRDLIERTVAPEVDALVGPFRRVMTVFGAESYRQLQLSTAEAALDMLPVLIEDDKFGAEQALHIEEFASARLRSLPPAVFMDILYSAVEQDAWLLYAHGGVLGFLVGAVHLLIFGA